MSNLGEYQNFTTEAKKNGGVNKYLRKLFSKPLDKMYEIGKRDGYVECQKETRKAIIPLAITAIGAASLLLATEIRNFINDIKQEREENNNESKSEKSE